MYMTQNALVFSDYSLKPLENHKWLLLLIFFSRLCITSGFPLAACEFFWRISQGRLEEQNPQAAKGNLLVHHKRLKGSRL
jgi:hypothetical protein